MSETTFRPTALHEPGRYEHFMVMVDGRYVGAVEQGTNGWWAWASAGGRTGGTFETREAAAEHLAGLPVQPRPSNVRCPRCGEYDVVTIEHDDLTGHEPDCPAEHSYCRNCDNGLCCGEC